VKAAGKVSLAFVGAGSYAQGNLLPNLPGEDQGVIRKGVMTASGTTSRRVAERFGFEFCTAAEKDVFDRDDINTVFIATRMTATRHTLSQHCWPVSMCLWKSRCAFRRPNLRESRNCWPLPARQRLC